MRVLSHGMHSCASDDPRARHLLLRTALDVPELDAL
jgi:hypothetical protein